MDVLCGYSDRFGAEMYLVSQAVGSSRAVLEDRRRHLRARVSGDRPQGHVDDFPYRSGIFQGSGHIALLRNSSVAEMGCFPAIRLI